MESRREARQPNHVLGHDGEGQLQLPLLTRRARESRRARRTLRARSWTTRALEAAGAHAVLLECVPKDVGAAIRAGLQVPVIGIGAGPDVDGQILVL